MALRPLWGLGVWGLAWYLSVDWEQGLQVLGIGNSIEAHTRLDIGFEIEVRVVRFKQGSEYSLGYRLESG